MERLELHYKTLLKAYGRLEFVIKAYEDVEKILQDDAREEPNHFIYRDSLIQRFEICYDLTWNFWKTCLKANHSVNIEEARPRKVFQECFRQGLLDEEEAKQFFKMIEARNNTSDRYDEIGADEISQQIPIY